MNETNLKPCPFCGDKAIMSSYGVNPTTFEIECETCGCHQKDYDSVECTIKTWNKRIGENVNDK